MDDYVLGSLKADFDTENKFNYSSSPDAVFRSPNSPTLSPLSGDLDADADYIVIIPFEISKRSLGTNKDTVAKLFEDWKIPKVAVSHLFKTDDRPQGFNTIATSSIRCCWYHIQVKEVLFSSAGTTEHLFHVWQVLDTTVSHVRILVFYPPFLAVKLKQVLLSAFKNNLSYDNLQWSEIHLSLIRTVISTLRWVHTSAAVGYSVVVSNF